MNQKELKKMLEKGKDLGQEDLDKIYSELEKLFKASKIEDTVLASAGSIPLSNKAGTVMFSMFGNVLFDAMIMAVYMGFVLGGGNE